MAQPLTPFSCQICRAFANLISTSSLLKYRLELLAAGLTENPRSPCGLEEGQRRVKEYVDMWKDPDAYMWPNPYYIKRRGYPLRQANFHWKEFIHIGRNLLARLSGCSVLFIRVPRITAGRDKVEEWRIEFPATSFRPITVAAYPPENVLALIECRHP